MAAISYPIYLFNEYNLRSIQSVHFFSKLYFRIHDSRYILQSEMIQIWKEIRKYKVGRRQFI